MQNDGEIAGQKKTRLPEAGHAVIMSPEAATRLPYRDVPKFCLLNAFLINFSWATQNWCKWQ